MIRIMKIALACIVVLFINTSAQTTIDTATKGIKFVEGLSWSEIITKAKVENKMIFVDFYTTWCAPCRVMEKYVYTSEELGTFFNLHFISVKVQMNRTVNDDDKTRQWYDEAKKMEAEFGIDAYPTFIFFSPDGIPLHRASGGFSESRFLALAKDAVNPEKQSYTLSAKYEPEKMDTAELRLVALSYRRSNPELAKKIAASYFRRLPDQHVLEMIIKGNDAMVNAFGSDNTVNKVANSFITTLSEKELFTVENINIMRRYSMNNSKDKGFRIFYQNPAKIDAVMNKGNEYKTWFVTNYVDDIIYKEEIAPERQRAKDEGRDPNWNVLAVNITRKYNSEYAERLCTKAKIFWYGSIKKWEKYCDYIIQYMDRYRKVLEFDYGYNTNAYLLFKHTNDTSKLQKALKWSSEAIMFNPNAASIDTYANLLYKLKRKPIAIRWQEVAIKLNPDDPELKETLQKMKDNVPTWPLN